MAALAELLREKGCRVLLTRAGGVGLLVPLLKGAGSPTNSQLLYELCVCLWELSYYPQAAQAMATAGEGLGGRRGEGGQVHIGRGLKRGGGRRQVGRGGRLLPAGRAGHGHRR